MRVRRPEIARGGRVLLPLLAAALGVGLAAALWLGRPEKGSQEKPSVPPDSGSLEELAPVTPDPDAGAPLALPQTPPATPALAPPAPAPALPLAASPGAAAPYLPAAARHLEALLHSSAREEDRSAALEALADELAGLSLEDGDPAAVRLLAEIAGLLRDTALAGGEEVAEAAVALLEEIPLPESMSALAEILRSAPTEELRLRAVDAIIYLDSSGAAGALAVGLADASSMVREAAANGMSWVEERDPRTLENLYVAHANEPDPDVRETLLHVLEDIQTDLQEGTGIVSP
jgi:hypothetical protein